MEQLKLAINSCDVMLSEEDLSFIDEIHHRCPNPCP